MNAVVVIHAAIGRSVAVPALDAGVPAASQVDRCSMETPQAGLRSNSSHEGYFVTVKSPIIPPSMWSGTWQ